ncbi:MAG TPA: hypothetical protein VN222_16820 [Novosphingobium sp.]|nr:hypothetical protein [Novosphingobium sp.]
MSGDWDEEWAASPDQRKRRPLGMAHVVAVVLALFVLMVAVTRGPAWLREWRSPAGFAAGQMTAGAQDHEQAQFLPCREALQASCVVDGARLHYQGAALRIAGIRVPDMASPRCAHERAMGRKAMRRLIVLLNAGAFRIEPAPQGTARIMRGNGAIGAVLVAEGLAQDASAPAHDWCL